MRRRGGEGGEGGRISVNNMEQVKSISNGKKE